MTTLAMIRLTDVFRIFTMLCHSPVRYDHCNVIFVGVERAVKNREEERKEIYGKRRWGGTKNWKIRKNGIRIEHKTKEKDGRRNERKGRKDRKKGIKRTGRKRVEREDRRERRELE